MRRFTWWVGVPVVAAVAGLVVGCLSSGQPFPPPVGAALDQPDVVFLYSLEPAPMTPLPTDKPAAETFHGNTVLGKVEITDAATRKKLFAAIRKGVDDHDGSVAACFIPHHGLRVISRKRVIDMVICFQCAQVKSYEADAEGETFLISTSPRATVNEILRAANVPLSSGAE